MEHLTINGQKIIKYVKQEEFDIDFEDLTKEKVSMGTEPPMENIWVGVHEKHPELMVLLNNALEFYPFPSWGMILPKEGYNEKLKEIKDSYIFPVSPIMWSKLIEEKVVNEEGYYIEMIKANEEEELGDIIETQGK